jgi:hypothetical protein
MTKLVHAQLQKAKTKNLSWRQKNGLTRFQI